MSGTIDSSGNIHRGAGIPGGGQFAGRVNAAPNTHLADDATEASITELLRRRAELIKAGYAPATAGPSLGTGPTSTDGIDTWWDEHFRRSEVRDGAGYNQMPDDFTPGMSAGRALSGRRRTHRMLYDGASIRLRMPSASAVKRYSASIDHATFDVPVQAEGLSGQVVSGFVRVTQEAPGKWTVTALNMPPQVAAKVSESVASVLEARRPSLALTEIGDLLQRRRERIARAGVRLDGVENSSWVNAMGYNDAAGEMIVTLGTRTYGYKVSAQVYHQVKNAFSAGAMYNRLVKGAPRVQVDQCTGCGRWFNTDAGHTCMQHRQPTGTVRPYLDRVRAHVLEAAGEPA